MAPEPCDTTPSPPHIAGTTLCLASTRDHELTAAAARHSASCCRFDALLYFSDRDWDLPGFTRHPIAPFASVRAYDHLILHGLLDHLETSHVLIAQYDGFVSDPALWTEDFLGFDYIGAPWPQFAMHAVGNGGFSLRSRRLLRALRDMGADPGTHPEDIAIARLWRPVLESSFGIRFAPPALARRFSREWGGGPAPSFGFHGVYNLHLHYRGAAAAWLAERLPPAQLAGWRVVMLALEYLRAGAIAEATCILHAALRAQDLASVDTTLARLRVPEALGTRLLCLV